MVDWISVQALQPSMALLSEDTKERIIDVREFRHGDLFKVLPDSIIPIDGIIVSGETEIDESMITGEAIPIPKTSGSRVVAGSVCRSVDETANRQYYQQDRTYG